MSLQHDYTLNPVTALEFYTSSKHTLLLSGEGSFLKVFDTKNSACLSQYEVFREQAIHGISVNQSSDQDEEVQVVIWGGRNLVLLSRKDMMGILDQHFPNIVSKSITVPDWILDVATSSLEKSSCVLITAHNTLLRAETGQAGRPPYWKQLPSPSESILYSAHVVWDTSSRILVAAGTVFGEIIVWESLASDKGIWGNARTLFTFTGHEGSIFGVNFSPYITFSGGKVTRLLASCSDDRTIRVWDLLESSVEVKVADKGNVLRETGFGKNEASIGDTVSGDRCLAMVMGHASRIWGVKFLVDETQDSQNSNVDIISFGEDSTAQQWKLIVGLLAKTPNRTNWC
jgi:WD40 repeat protein